MTAFLQRPTARTRAALAATGAVGLSRVLAWWFGPATSDRPAALGVPDRELADRWLEAIAVLGCAHPSVFMDALAGTTHLRHVVDVLGQVDDRRAVDALVRFATDDDWLTRRSAVRGLAHHDTPPVRAVLDAALADVEPVVRLAAIESLAGRDPVGAAAAARVLLDDPACTPLLHHELRRFLRRKRTAPLDRS